MDEDHENRDAHDEALVGDVAPEPSAPPAPRLRRSPTRRVIGGVAGGVGERFDIDPNIVRVIFVVLTLLWGLGVAIYLAMWVLIPRDKSGASEPNVDDDAPASTSRWSYVALAAGVVVLGLIFVSTVGGVPAFGKGLVLLWLVFLIVLAVVSLGRPSRRLSAGRALSMLFLIGLSVVIIAAGVFLGLLQSFGVPLSGGDGVRAWQPTTLAQVQHVYRVEFGSVRVDLSGVAFPASGYAVTVSVAAGTLTVKVPGDAVVDVRTRVGLGSVSAEDQVSTYFWSSGPFVSVPASLATARSQALAPHLSLVVEVGVGHIDLLRTLTSPGAVAPRQPSAATP